MTDHRQLIERVMDVIHQRIDQAERIGLQKLEEIEQRGWRESERAERKQQERLRRSERRRARDARRAGRRGRAAADPGAAGARGAQAGEGAGGVGSGARVRRAPSAEERAYRAARRRVNMRLAFYAHFGVYVSVIVLLLLTVRSFRAALVVALSWGIGVFLHYFWSLLAPSLRERWIEREVGERVDHDLSSERRKVEDRHVRNLEDLSASIAHEIRNPITAAKSLVQQMGEDPVSRDNLEYASVALEELDRVERSISHLLRFARDEELHFVELEMAEVVRSAVETFKDRIARSGIDVECQLDSRGQMRGDPDKLRRVVINLIGNAIDAFEGAGTQSPRLTIMSGDNLAGSEVWLRVRDNGPGIPREKQSKIFDPFFTTKRSGTGLGLALSKKVVDAHGGALELESSPETGTEFVISFPKDARPQQARGPGSAS